MYLYGQAKSSTLLLTRVMLLPKRLYITSQFYDSPSGKNKTFMTNKS